MRNERLGENWNLMKPHRPRPEACALPADPLCAIGETIAASSGLSLWFPFLSEFLLLLRTFIYGLSPDQDVMTPKILVSLYHTLG